MSGYGASTYGMYAKMIDCPKCGGTGYEPSAVTKVRSTCTYCHGSKYFYANRVPRP